MNMHVTGRRAFDPGREVVEELLIRTAIRIELPPSLHGLAVERYDAVRNHIERDGSPLKDRVRLFYPQGSMAIRATIRSRKRERRLRHRHRRRARPPAVDGAGRRSWTCCSRRSTARRGRATTAR